MNWYEEKLLPRLIDLACGGRPFERQRAAIVPRATGDVLEIGFGSGRNLPFYDPRRVRRLWALEPSAGMRRLAADKLAASGLDVVFLDLPGEEIPLADASVDTVLITYTLCTIPDPLLALAGVRRVLRPGGRLLYCEHGRAPDAGVRRWQARLNPLWRRLAGGCNLDRDIARLITEAGFRIEDEERRYISGPRVLTYNYRGSAAAP